MESISRICATSKGTTIDAIGQGRYPRLQSTCGVL